MKTLDPEELKSKLKYLKISWTHDDLYWLMRLIKLIDDMSTMEVKPIKKGRWIRLYNQFPQRFECTECGGKDVGMYAFCHHCGAEMERGIDKND